MTGKRGMTGMHGNHQTGRRVEYIRLTCVKCGVGFEKSPGFMRAHPTTRFCSHKCGTSVLAVAGSKVSVNCCYCGKSFSKRADHLRERNFCGTACSHEARKKQDAKWNDKAHISAYNKMYRDANKDRLIKAAGDWAKRNKEARLQIQARYRDLHADKITAHTGLRRSRLSGGDLTPAEWSSIKEAHGYRCAHCGADESKSKLTLDHIVPIKAGGRHTKSNVQPLCRSCNSRKGDRCDAASKAKAQQVLLT